MTITNLFQPGFWQEAPLSNIARGLNFLWELFTGRVDGHFLSIWTCEGSPQLLTQDQNQQHFPVSHCLNLTHHHCGQHHPADLHHWVSIMIYGATWGLCSQPIIGVSCCLCWIGRKIGELGFWFSGLWLPGGWVGWELCPLLMLPSLVPGQAL